MNGFSMSEIEAFVSRFYPGRNLLLTPYSYPMQFTLANLAAGGQDVQQLQISANADFCMLGLGYVADDDGTSITVGTKPAFIGRILITDTGSNEQFTQAPVALETYAQNGNANGAGSLIYARMVGGRSVLQVQMFNDDSTAYNVNLNFFGVLVRAYSDGPGAGGRLGNF